jgi:hypothetical protein
MSTVDLSRQITDPRKHYAGVRMQQGRVLTDDDFNEASILDDEELRRTRLHAIGAYGSPNAGFLPKNFAVGAGGKLDFTFTKGELYLGGLRLEMSIEEKFLEQKDWLDFDPAVEAVAAPAAGGARTDLVWMEAWQQPVTATEDKELFEVALGGPDTTTRWRTMRRMHLASGVAGNSCPESWAAVAAGFAGLGILNEEFELTTAATLTVSFTAPPIVGDLCSPPLAGGYLGAENQAIRVQMVDAGHYTWGYDDAAPLYRVLVSAKGGQMVKLTFQTPPKDAAHWPLKGQVMELLPWAAALPNGQRVAELAGHLCKVNVSYDPDDHTLEIDVPVPAGFNNLWAGRSDKAEFFDGSAEENFVYLRAWNRGDDIVSPASIPIANGDLGNTGLHVAFNGGPLRPADYWIIAARPAAPDTIMPWRLTSLAGAPPNGLKWYRAPLGLIQWSTDAQNNVTGVLVHDCRPPFLPLTRIRNCCSVTVGDGIESFGMFKSINAAIDSLPSSGGVVCVLPGRYEESVRISKRKNVTVHGCGVRSRIVAPKQEGEGSTALSILESVDICIETLALEGGGDAVIRVEHGEAVRIASCLVQFRDGREAFSVWPAIFIDGHLIELENNIVEPVPKDLDHIFHKVAEAVRGGTASAARGGVQLAGGCEHVRVAGNVIVGGIGNGITLGSILRFDDDHPDGDGRPDIDVDDPCAPCDPTDGGTPPDDGGKVHYRSAGDLYDIDIDDNVIVRQGANGIAVVRFFGLAKTGLVLVTVHGLRIERNRIFQCLRRPIATSKSAMTMLLGYGGISLAFVIDLEIDGNVILRNGHDWLSPVCGVFALAADGLRVEHNLIQDNGPRSAEPPDAAQPGIRAGVHIWLALSLQIGGSTKAETAVASFAVVQARRSGVDQLRVHGNRIQQPLGRALFMAGAGPMSITDNRLVSEGLSERVTDPFATTALVADFGISKEWTLGLLVALIYLIQGKLEQERICQLAREGVRTPILWSRLPTGKLAFNDNQVSFLMPDASPGLDLSSTLLLSLDDVGACDNQFEYHVENRVAVSDLLAVGQTVRTNDNRLAETWGRVKDSILSFGLLNTAADNQSTHCIQAAGLKRAVHDNLIMAEAFCDNACGNSRQIVNQLATGADMAFGLHT